MTRAEDEETAGALRAMLSERIGTLTPPSEMYAAVRRRHRYRQRLAAGAVVAAVVAVAGVPYGLSRSPAEEPAGPAPCPTTTAPSPSTSRPLRVSELPRQTGIRGSLAGDRALVDAALVTGWQELSRQAELNGWTPAPGTARVRLVERAGPGVVALVTATDSAASRRSARWLAGPPGALAPADGLTVTGNYWRTSLREFGADPLFAESVEVCGRPYAVVLAPPDATVTITPAARIAADARPVPVTARPARLTGGLAVVTLDGSGSTVRVSRGGTVLGSRQLDVNSVDAARPSDRDVAEAVAAGPGPVDAELARAVIRVAGREVTGTTGDVATGVRVLWGGRLPDGSAAVLVALTLPSGAVFVTEGAGPAYPRGSSSFAGLLPAEAVDRALLAWRTGNALVVRAPGAARAEVVLAGGDVRPVPLAGTVGTVTVPAGTGVAEVRTYASDGTLLGRGTPGAGLLPLQGER